MASNDSEIDFGDGSCVIWVMNVFGRIFKLWPIGSGLVALIGLWGEYKGTSTHRTIREGKYEQIEEPENAKDFEHY